MLFNELQKRFLFFRTHSFFIFSFLILFFVALSTVKGVSQNTEEEGALFILKGNTKLASGKSVEGVDIELKKNGQTVSKITSGKNGKYYLQMEVSTTNMNNDYLLYITQVGTIPKTLSINAYIPPEEFALHSYARYDFSLEIKMIETTKQDTVIERPSGKIHWDIGQHGFAFDQSFAKVVQKEDPDDREWKQLVEKKRKEDEEAVKKKADEEAKRLADQKAKEEADRILQQNLEAMKQEIKRKRRQDSLDSMATRSAGKTTVEVKKFEKPVSAADVDQNAFDGTGAYSINIAEKSQKAYVEKMNRKKAANLSAKYETNNILTSLLDMVDEQDKKMKKQ
ncbi:MAG: hypothetical protein ACHQHP_03525 [Bacteroidia bacterium]